MAVSAASVVATNSCQVRWSGCLSTMDAMTGMSVGSGFLAGGGCVGESSDVSVDDAALSLVELDGKVPFGWFLVAQNSFSLKSWLGCSSGVGSSLSVWFEQAWTRAWHIMITCPM